MAVEKGMEDIRAVLDAVGSQRTALLGFESGGTVMLLFAASYPGRVSALGLLAPLVYYWRTPDWPGWFIEEDARDWKQDIASNWGTAEFWRRNAEGMGEGDMSADDAERWARFTRLCASPSAALAIEEVERQVDVRALLPQIQLPTMVMRSRGDRERGSGTDAPRIAELIPGARYVELSHAHHFPMDAGVYRPFENFLAGIRDDDVVFDRMLATVLFTDIVDSTATAAVMGDANWRRLLARAAELGDGAWRTVVASHHEIVRRELARFGGIEVDTAGDGFLATFDGPARAVRCAQAIGAVIGELGLEVRAGVHTGEVETIDGKVGGIAVHVGARIGALAGPSEVLASSTVKDLVAGSGLAFEDAGDHELKGVPDRWHLYRVIG